MYSTFYAISIANIAGSAPSDGFVDNTKVQVYALNGGTPVATYAASTAKRRANLRYVFMTQQLDAMGNIYINDIVAAGAGADANTAPTTFSFVAEIERGDAVLSTPDELNPGQRLTGVAALTRAIARMLIQNETIETSVIDPTVTPAPGQTNTTARVIERVVNLAVGPLASSLATAATSITVTKVV